MTQYESVRTPQDYVNYTFNISSKGVTQVAGELAGLSSTVSTILGDIAFKTSEFLSHTEMMAIGAGSAVSAVFVKATQDAIRFEQQVANVKAIGGESVNAALIGDKAMEYSNKLGMAVSEMTEGLEALARAGITTTSVMTQVLEEGVKLSKLEGISLEDSVNHLISTTNLLSQDKVDMNAPEYAQMLKDMNQHIVSTSESAPINAENIMQTLQHVGGYASASGIDQDDLFAVIAQLGARGTKGEMAGTALRAFVSAGNKDTAQRALKRVGLDVTDLWDATGETMLSISEMKDVLDNALDARGYSKQEKLEFYSDFVGYKQANQIMKIDTTEVEKYKDSIANAWDLGTKLNTILGTVKGNLDRIWQISQNFMTKVGGKLLPVINAMLVPIRVGLELFTKIPFMDSLGAGLALFAGLRTILLVINNIVPAIGGLFSSMRSQKQYAKGIRGEWEKTRDAIKDAYEVMSNINNKDKLAQINRQRRGPSAEDKAHMEDTIFEAMYHESKYYQELKIPWKKLEPGLQHAIGREFLGTPEFEANWKRMTAENEAIASDMAKEASVLNFGEYEPEGELVTINRYVQYIYRAMKEAKAPLNNRERNQEQTTLPHTEQETSRTPYTEEKEPSKVEVFINGRNASQSAFQFEDINKIKTQINVSEYGDYANIYRDNTQQLIKDYNQAINDLIRKANSFSNTKKEYMDKTQTRRYEKSLRREAMSEEGIRFASRANDSDIRHFLKTGIYREPKDKMLGIQDDQIKAMGAKVGLDFSDIDNITGPDKRKEQLTEIRKQLKEKNISIDDVAEEANKVWIEKQQEKRKVTYIPTQLLRTNKDMTLQLAAMFTEPTSDISQAIQQVQSYFANDVDNSDIVLAAKVMMGHIKKDGEIFSNIEKEEIKYILENIVRLENTAQELGVEMEDASKLFQRQPKIQLPKYFIGSMMEDIFDQVQDGVISLNDVTQEWIADYYKDWIGTVTPTPLNTSAKYTVNDSLYNRIIHNKEFKEDDLNIIIQDLLNGEDRYYNEAKSRITKRALSIHSPSTKQYHNVTQYKDDNGHVVYVEHGKSGDFITTKQKFATQKGFVDDYHLRELSWDMDKGVASRAFLPDYFEDAHRIPTHVNGWKKNVAHSLYLERNIHPLSDEKTIKLIEERLGVNIERGDNAFKQVQSSLNNAGNQTKLLEQYGLYYDKKAKRVVDILNPEAFQEGIFKGLISRNQVNRWRKQGFIGYDKYQIDDTFDLLESSGGKNIQHYYKDEEEIINRSIVDIMSDFAMYRYQTGENIVNIQDIISHTQSQIKDILRYTDDELEEMLINNSLYGGYITKEGFNVGYFNDILNWGLDQKRRYSANDLAKMDYKNLQVSPYVLSAFGLDNKYDYSDENDVQQLLNDINEGKIFDKNMPIFTATKNIKKRKKTVTFKKKDLKLKYGHIDSEWAKTSEEYQNMKNKLYAYFDEEQKDLDSHVFEPIEVMKYVNKNFKHIEKSARELMAVDIIHSHSDFKDRDDSQLEQYVYNKRGKKFDILTPFEIEKNNWKDWDKYMKGGNFYLSAAELRSLDWADIFAPEWLEPLSMDAQWERFGKEYLKNLYPDLEYENIAEEMAITFADDKLLKDKKIFAISKKKFLEYYQHDFAKDADIDMFGVGEFRGTGYIADILRTAQLAIDEFNDQIDTVNLLEAMDRDYKDKDKDIPQITFIDTREEIINQIENSQNKISDAVKTTVEDIQKTEEDKITKIKSRKHLGNFTIGTKPLKTTYDEKDILPSIMMIAMAKEYDNFMDLIEGDLIDDEDVANLSNKDISALYNVVYAEMSKIKDVKKARTKKDKMNEIRDFMKYGFMDYDTWEGYNRDEGKDFINNAVLNFFAEKYGTTRKVTSNLPETRYISFHIQDEEQLKAIQEYNEKRNKIIPSFYTRYNFNDLKVGDTLDYDSERILSSLILSSILYPHANINDILQQQSKANLSLAPLFEDFLRTGNKEIFKYEFGEVIVDSIFREMQMNDSLMQSASWTTNSKKRAENLRDALPHEDSKVYDFTIDLLVKAFTDKINSISEGYGGLWGDEYQHEGYMETLDENNEAIWRLDGHILEIGNNINMAKTMITDITNLANGDARAALYAESRNMGRFGGNFFDNNLPDKVIIAMAEALGLEATGNRFQDIIAIADFMSNQGVDEIENGTYINPDKIAAIGVNKYLEEMQPVLTMDTFDDYYEAMRQVNSMIRFGQWADIYGHTTVGIQAMADAVPNVPKYNDYEYKTDKIAAFLEDNPTFKETFRRIGIDAINREYGYYTGVETAPFDISNGIIDVNLVDDSVSPIETIKETVKEIKDSIKKDKEVQEQIEKNTSEAAEEISSFMSQEPSGRIPQSFDEMEEQRLSMLHGVKKDPNQSSLDDFITPQNNQSKTTITAVTQHGKKVQELIESGQYLEALSYYDTYKKQIDLRDNFISNWAVVFRALNAFDDGTLRDNMVDIPLEKMSNDFFVLKDNLIKSWAQELGVDLEALKKEKKEKNQNNYHRDTPWSEVIDENRTDRQVVFGKDYEPDFEFVEEEVDSRTVDEKYKDKGIPIFSEENRTDRQMNDDYIHIPIDERTDAERRADAFWMEQDDMIKTASQMFGQFDEDYAVNGEKYKTEFKQKVLRKRADAFWAEQERLEQEAMYEEASKNASTMFNNFDTDYEENQEQYRKDFRRQKQSKYVTFIEDSLEKIYSSVKNKTVNANKWFDENFLNTWGDNAKVWGETADQLRHMIEPLDAFNRGLSRLSEIFPILTPLVYGLDKILEVSKTTISGLRTAETLLMAVRIASGKETEDLAQKEGYQAAKKYAEKMKQYIPEGSDLYEILDRVGEYATRAFSKLKYIFAQAIGFIAENIVILGPIAAAIAIAVGGLWLSEQNHAKALKEATEEYEAAHKEAQASYITYKNIHEARKNEHDAMKRQQLARKESIALYELEADRIKQLNALEEKTKLKNDGLWGEYGARANFQKMGWLESIFAGGIPFVGTIAKWMSGEFESQYEQYEGSTGEVRRIKEDSVGNIFATGNQKAVSAWYDSHVQQLGQIEAFAPELQELYNLESKLIERYGSLEAARNSEEFNKAVQEFADATGLNKETAEKYLDYLQTEANVENARYAMQAEVNIITSKAQAEAYKALYGDEAGVGELNGVQDAMVYATADQIFKDAYQELWWNMLMEWLQAIYNVITLHLGEAQKHAQAAGAYQNGMRELAENQGRITQEGVDIAKENQRKDYKNGSYTSSYGDTPFGGAVASSVAQEQNWAEEEMNRQDMYYNASKANGEAATQGFKDGLNQHSPGDISRSVGDEMEWALQAMSGDLGFEQSMTQQAKNMEKGFIGFDGIYGKNNTIDFLIDTVIRQIDMKSGGASTVSNGFYRNKMLTEDDNWIGGNVFESIGRRGQSIFSGFSKAFNKAKNIKIDNSKTEVHIHTVNINTDDNPEKIKTALMELIVEFGDLVTPKQVSRIIGTPPSTSTSSTEDIATEDENAENTENSDTNNNPTT